MATGNIRGGKRNYAKVSAPTNVSATTATATITVDVNGRITSASTGAASSGETFNPLLLMGA